MSRALSAHRGGTRWGAIRTQTKSSSVEEDNAYQTSSWIGVAAIGTVGVIDLDHYVMCGGEQPDNVAPTSAVDRQIAERAPVTVPLDHANSDVAARVISDSDAK